MITQAFRQVGVMTTIKRRETAEKQPIQLEQSPNPMKGT
jgi:hypothetical protein